MLFVATCQTGPMPLPARHGPSERPKCRNSAADFPRTQHPDTILDGRAPHPFPVGQCVSLLSSSRKDYSTSAVSVFPALADRVCATPMSLPAPMQSRASHGAAFRVSAIRLRSLAQVAGSEKASASNDLRHECSDSDCERRQKRSEDEPIGIADAVFVARHGQSSQSNTPSVLDQTIGHRMGSAIA